MLVAYAKVALMRCLFSPYAMKDLEIASRGTRPFDGQINNSQISNRQGA